jgi:hypothetical protein
MSNVPDFHRPENSLNNNVIKIFSIGQLVRLSYREDSRADICGEWNQQLWCRLLRHICVSPAHVVSKCVPYLEKCLLHQFVFKQTLAWNVNMWLH